MYAISVCPSIQGLAYLHSSQPLYLYFSVTNTFDVAMVSLTTYVMRSSCGHKGVITDSRKHNNMHVLAYYTIVHVHVCTCCICVYSTCACMLMYMCILYMCMHVHVRGYNLI